MTKIEIVRLSPEVWQQYRNIRLESLRSDPQAFGSRYEEMLQRPNSFWQSRLADTQAGDKKWLLFAREDGLLIGMIGAYAEEENDVVHIISVYVTKEKRGHGVGSLLMRAILEEVIKPGVFHKAVLGVNREQTAAVALYQHFGFKVVGEMEDAFEDGTVRYGYVMEKKLGKI